MLLSHEFEQLGSLHMCASRKDIGAVGFEPSTPGLSVNHATNELTWRHMYIWLWQDYVHIMTYTCYIRLCQDKDYILIIAYTCIYTRPWQDYVQIMMYI